MNHQTAIASIYVVPPDVMAQALETFVAARMGVDRLEVRAWVKDGHVTVDGGPAKASRYVTPGQVIAVARPPARPHEAVPEDLPLPIRYEDEHLVVVAKPSGMATHPGPGWWTGSCVNALLHAVRVWPGVGGVAGPGIVHRLDRDTTGLLIFAKTDAAHQPLLRAAAERGLQRTYLAWVDGEVTLDGVVDAPLARDPQDPQRVIVTADGKAAVTRYAVRDHRAGHTLLELVLETGRNHQIRAHMTHLGHPVVGDPVYGRGGPFMALHAWRLAFDHPLTGMRIDLEEAPPFVWAALGPLPLGR